MITAQDLYDRREELGEIDGQELHGIFQAVCGDPSPVGQTEIDIYALAQYAMQQRQIYAQHKQGGGVGGEYLFAIARFCDAFVVESFV